MNSSEENCTKRSKTEQGKISYFSFLKPEYLIKSSPIEVRDKMIEQYLSLSKDERGMALNHITKYIKRSTFYYWVRRYKEQGKLIRKKRSDSGKRRKLVPEYVKQLAEALVISRPQYNIQRALDGIKALCAKGELFDPETGELCEEVSEYVLREHLNNSLVQDKWFFRWYPKSRRTLFASMSHSRGINPPNTVWMIDDHDQDLLVWSEDKEGKRRQIRPKVIRVLDPETNMIVGWSMTDDTYGSVEIKTAVLDAIIRTKTIPMQIYIECDKRMRESGLLDGAEWLGIKIIGTPYNPTAKTNVEHSFCNDRMELDANYSSYINNNTVNRPDDAHERVFHDYSEYLADYAAYVEHWNSTRLSIYRGKVKKTPIEMWNAWVKKGWNPKILPNHIIEKLPYRFSKRELRHVRAGRIQFTIDGEVFYYLGECLLGMPEGYPVHVRRKFGDLRDGYVYIGDNNIGKVFLQEKVGYGFEEYGQPEAIKLIQGFRLKRAKLLKVSDDAYPFIASYIRRIDELAKSKKDAKMIIPRKVIQFISEKESSAIEELEKHRKQEVQELQNESREEAKRSSNNLDDEIKKILNI